MEILAGITAFLQIANLIFNIRDKLEIPKEDKVTLGDGLINIGNLIRSVAEDLNKGVYPAGKCQQMDLYAGELNNILKGQFSEKDAARLNDYLSQALHVERLLGELNNISLEAKDKNIELLEIAASSFIASGEIVKLK